MNIKLNKFDKVCPSCKGSKMCSRCGGSGKHSYNLRDRDICFGCAGAKNCSRCGGSGIKRFYAIVYRVYKLHIEAVFYSLCPKFLEKACKL